jgi:hypothetical protein
VRAEGDAGQVLDVGVERLQVDADPGSLHDRDEGEPTGVRQ